MALHKDFPESPYAILDPALRWFPADEALRETSMDKLMPPLVPTLRRKVKDWRDSGYVGATDTSKTLLHWWFDTPHLLGIAASAPYLHDGRAATLEEIWTVYNPKDQHGVTNSMNKIQLNDLIEYLKRL